MSKPMKVTTLVLNPQGEPHFKATDHLDLDYLFEFAKERKELAQENGADWTMGAVTFYGTELIKAVNGGEHRDVTVAITNMVMATWLYDSIFLGATVEQYRKSSFEFVVANDGSVAHTRVPAGE